MRKKGVIKFKHLWAIFVPGDIIILKERGVLTAGKLVEFKSVQWEDNLGKNDDGVENFNNTGWGSEAALAAKNDSWGGAESSSESKKVVKKADERNKSWQLEFEQYDFDGENQGFVTTFVYLGHYDGSRPLEELPYVPLRLLPDQADITEKLIAKGRKFETLLGSHVKNYDGQKLVNSGRTNQYVKKVSA